MKNHDYTLELLDCIERLNSEYNQRSAEVSNIDLEQEDLLHDIELTNFNAYEGFLMAKKLQEVRQRRRQIKDRESQLRGIKDLVTNAGMYKKLLTQAERNVKQEEFLSKRVYKPRIRTDLKLIRLNKAN